LKHEVKSHIGHMLRNPPDNGFRTAFEMGRQHEVPHDDLRVFVRQQKVSRGDVPIVVYIGVFLRALVISIPEIGQIYIYHAAQQLHRLFGTVHVGVPNHWRVHVTFVHDLQYGMQVRRRFAANEVYVSRALVFSRPYELRHFLRQDERSGCRGSRYIPVLAVDARKSAARKEDCVRWHQFRLFPIVQKFGGIT